MTAMTCKMSSTSLVRLFGGIARRLFNNFVFFIPINPLKKSAALMP
jgi:hypothetical protein